MIHDLDEALEQLLVEKGGLDPALVDIRFEAPTRERLSAVNIPTVNLYLYDLRENLELREMNWDVEREGNQRVRIKRRPLRIDLSYTVTCWTTAVEDQHRLLWRVMETLFRHTPLPDELHRGELMNLLHPVQLKVAQPDGVLKNLSDVWGSLQVEYPPSIQLVATLELDLNQVVVTPLVFARALKVESIQADENHQDSSTPESELLPLRVGGIVQATTGDPLPNIPVQLCSSWDPRKKIRLGPTAMTNDLGRYVFDRVPPGEYMLVIDVPGRVAHQQTVHVDVGKRWEPPPELVHAVEVKMPRK
jgi:hypothetical protein